MSRPIIIALSYGSSLACIIFAGLGCLHDSSGWGWFLAAAVALQTSISFGDAKS